jgi:hypothetical protein
VCQEFRWTEGSWNQFRTFTPLAQALSRQRNVVNPVVGLPRVAPGEACPRFWRDGSTPFGITEVVTAKAPTGYQDSTVLNALRHHCGRHERAAAARFPNQKLLNALLASLSSHRPFVDEKFVIVK